MLSEMIFQKRHNPLDEKGNTDFSLLSSFRIREGRKQARHIPTPANTALENSALALGTAWGRWDARQPSPETWSLPTSGRETRLMNSNALQKSAQTVVNKTRKRTAVGGGRRLPGNSTVPSLSWPHTEAEIPSPSWRVFPDRVWSMFFPRRSFI